MSHRPADEVLNNHVTTTTKRPKRAPVVRMKAAKGLPDVSKENRGSVKTKMEQAVPALI